MVDKIQNEPEQQPADSTLLSAAKLSQVSGEKKGKLLSGNFKWLLFAIVVLVAASMIFSGGSEKKKDKAIGDIGNKQEAQAELLRNAARLAQKFKAPAVNILENRPELTKEYLARQNAPTGMYSTKAPQRAVAMNKTNGAKEVTLADNSTNAAFANKGIVSATAQAYRIAHPGYTIVAGEFIHAQLETAINSDLPGMVRAVVTRPVYPYLSQVPIIPAGSRLIGQYSSAILQGQNRIMIAWNRVVLPSGIAVNISSPGVDSLGRAGQAADRLDTHFVKRFGEASLLSLIGAGVATYGVSSGGGLNSAAQYRAAIAGSFQESAKKSLQNNLPIKPTIHIYQGTSINVFIARDLSFYNVLGR